MLRWGPSPAMCPGSSIVPILSLFLAYEHISTEKDLGKREWSLIAGRGGGLQNRGYTIAEKGHNKFGVSSNMVA